MPSHPSADVRILVAHTDTSFREKVRTSVEQEGFTVIEVVDGEAALEVAQKENPHVIILDLVLPRLNGPEVLKRLYRLVKGSANIPVLVAIDDRTREDDIDGVVAVNEGVQFIKDQWAPDHIAAKVKEVLAPASSPVK